MDKFFIGIYGQLKRFKGRGLMTPLRVIIRLFANLLLPIYYKYSNRPVPNESCDVIISLTSYPGRISKLWLVVESLLRQDITPSKIILWLSKEQFPDSKIPSNLSKLQNNIFDIRFVDGDIKSHKKYFYAMKEFPNSVVATFDDDIIYPTNILRLLYESYLDKPNAIHSNITALIEYKDGNIQSYTQWSREIERYDQSNQLQIGAGGVLYPPNVLYKDLLNKDLFMKLAPAADDLWLNCMARLNGLQIIHTKFNKLLLPIVYKNDSPLNKTNVGGSCRNDIQLSNIRSYYIETSGNDPYACS